MSQDINGIEIEEVIVEDTEGIAVRWKLHDDHIEYRGVDVPRSITEENDAEDVVDMGDDAIHFTGIAVENAFCL